MKIAIVGGPSTGKTTLIKGKGRTRGLAERLRRRGCKVGIIDDQARIYIEKWIRGKREMILADQLWILRDWLREERKAEERGFDFIICDGASFLAYNYCFLFRSTDDEISARQRVFKREIFEVVMENLASYDYIFFLPAEFPPEEDGLRLWTDKIWPISLNIRVFLNTYLFLDPKVHTIGGRPKERINKILEIILKPC